MPDEVLLLSIKPEYAEKIFSGTKRVELRRSRPRVGAGQYVLVYVSSPVKQLHGTFKIEKVEVASPSKLWRRVRSVAGITKAEFDQYFAGAEAAFAIYIDDTTKWETPVELSTLRKRIPRFSPPQCFQYFALENVRKFTGGSVEVEKPLAI